MFSRRKINWLAGARGLTLIGAFVLLTGAFFSAHCQEMDDEMCLGCHSVEGVEEPDGRQLEAVSEESFSETPHEGFSCSDCHSIDKKVGIGKNRTMHAEFPPVDCVTCHAASGDENGETYAELYEKSIHGIARKTRHQDTAPACQDCHGRHAIYPADDARSRISPKHVQETCSSCHIASEAAKAGRKAAPIHYNAKAHAGLLKKNPDLKGSSCTDCHGEHGIPAKQEIPMILVADHALAAVPFDHLIHEQAVVSCSVCHHRSLRACRDCHSLNGGNESHGISAYEAYHWPTAAHSCVGCHERKKEAQNCAVCHESMKAGPYELSCKICHAGGSGESEREMSDPLAALPPDMPDVISVKTRTKELGPVKFPHRHVVESLIKSLGDNRLANIFHNGRQVVCTACHHHSPMGQKPPSCATCHTAKQDYRNLNKPSLKGAYHRKCLGCHKEMEVNDYIFCSSCHVERIPEGPLSNGAAK